MPRAGNGALIILLVLDAGLFLGVGWTFLNAEAIGAELVIGLAVLLPLSALFSWIMVGLLRSRVVIKSEGLLIDVPIYRRTIEWKTLKVDLAERLDDPLPDAWKLKWRTNGIGLPGYMVGWFSTRTGEKVFAAMTSKPVVHIPTTGRHHLILSVDDPDAFLSALRA